MVATWDKQFRSSDMAQKVPLLYLANDILQNSKRKGNEFVTEFWKVLPSALKEVESKGDDRGKNVVSRLVSSPTFLHDIRTLPLYLSFPQLQMNKVDYSVDDDHFIYCSVDVSVVEYFDSSNVNLR